MQKDILDNDGENDDDDHVSSEPIHQLSTNACSSEQVSDERGPTQI